jgi:anti-repressor protein
MNDLQIFKNEKFGQVRVVEENGEPWFVAKDICDTLDLGNTTMALRGLRNRWLNKIDVPHPQNPNKEMSMNFVNETGFYKLVFRSNKPEAEQFTDWIAEEVLPSIRKHGMYATDNTIDKILADPDFGIQLLSQLKEEREEKKKLVGKINELKPKADYVDAILRNKGLVTITQISKDYGMSGRAMNYLLHSLGVQYKQSGQWLLYAEHQGKGYTHSHTVDITRSDGQPDVIMHTKWTQKGRLFLYDLLRDEGVLPVIEQAS